MRAKLGKQMRAKEMDQNAKQMKQNERNRKTQKGGKSSIEKNQKDETCKCPNNAHLINSYL